ncbi:MAG: hypothetical protein HYY06_15200 [Deltaproteobacteria bacterium]|nr:hypothetical protein [Deltaproteobacteria bacterium]
MVRLHRQGRCPEALDRAVQIQDRLPEFPLVKQAHYAIYRGACHVALRQAAAAQPWLAQAAQMRAQYPGLITLDHSTVLDQAIAAMNQMAPPPPPTVQVAPPPPAVAMPPAAEEAPPPPAVSQ